MASKTDLLKVLANDIAKKRDEISDAYRAAIGTADKELGSLNKAAAEKAMTAVVKKIGQAGATFVSEDNLCIGFTPSGKPEEVKHVSRQGRCYTNTQGGTICFKYNAAQKKAYATLVRLNDDQDTLLARVVTQGEELERDIRLLGQSDVLVGKIRNITSIAVNPAIALRKSA